MESKNDDAGPDPDAPTQRERQEDALDEALKESFPASDPPAPVQPHHRKDAETSGRDARDPAKKHNEKKN
jgi:hypothetical protein